MRKFRGFLVLLSLSLLLNLTSCLYSRQKKTYAVFADSSREVTLATGTNRMRIGFVLDHREFKICDYEGNEHISMDFDCDIDFLDMMNYYVLFGFSDNHVEVYYMGPDESYILCEHSFEHSIKQAELTDDGKCGIVVLLEDGTLWTSSKDDPKRIKQIAEHVNDYAYDYDENNILYCDRYGKLHINLNSGTKCVLGEKMQNLQDVQAVDAISFESYQNGKIRYVIQSESGRDFVKCEYSLDADEYVLSMCTMEDGIVDYSISKWRPIPIVYRLKGVIYYEGPTYNQRRICGYDTARVKMPAQEDYEIVAILGGAVYYNEHEVKVVLVG